MDRLGDSDNPLSVFSFEGAEIRTLTDESGQPWWVAMDVARTLGYRDTDQAVRNHCKSLKTLKPVDSTGLDLGPRGVTIIPESDLYRLIIKSRLFATSPDASAAPMRFGEGKNGMGTTLSAAAATAACTKVGISVDSRVK